MTIEEKLKAIDEKLKAIREIIEEWEHLESLLEKLTAPDELYLEGSERNNPQFSLIPYRPLPGKVREAFKGALLGLKSQLLIQSNDLLK